VPQGSASEVPLVGPALAWMGRKGEPVSDPAADVAVATLGIDAWVPKRRDIDAERPQAGNTAPLVDHADPRRVLSVPGRQQAVDEPAGCPNIPHAAHPRPERHRG